MFGNKFGKFEEMDVFLAKFKLVKSSQEVESMNRSNDHKINWKVY